jgi:hypothetical protein
LTFFVFIQGQPGANGIATSTGARGNPGPKGVTGERGVPGFSGARMLF